MNKYTITIYLSLSELMTYLHYYVLYLHIVNAAVGKSHSWMNNKPTLRIVNQKALTLLMKG